MGNGSTLSLAAPANLRHTTDPFHHDEPRVSRSILFALRSLGLGGAERVAADIVMGLVTAGHRVRVLEFADTPGPAAAWFSSASEIIQVGRQTSPDALARSRAAADIDTLVLCGPSPAYRALPVLKRRNPALRIVGFMFNARQLVDEHRANAAYLDGVIAESAEAAAALGPSGPPVRVASSGVDISAIFARKILARVADPLVVGYVGRFDRTKNPRGFLDIARRLRGQGFRFTMAGPGPRWFRPPRDVSFAGPLFGEDKERFLDGLDILVVPSRHDGRPLVIHEAQARGQVVVASSVGAIPELITDGENGLLCGPGDVAGFAAAIARLAADTDLRHRLGEAARERVRHQGDIGVSLPLYLDAIIGD
jgi:glycosyltransferase involved in cell wall biosynthesis